MKFLVALACLVAAAYAADSDIQVVRTVQEVLPESYNYAYELNNGVSAQESGSLKAPESIAAQGSYKFTAPDGQAYETQYVADENGYQPTGAHLPQIPELIQRSLAYLASAKPYVEKN